MRSQQIKGVETITFVLIKTRTKPSDDRLICEGFLRP